MQVNAGRIAVEDGGTGPVVLLLPGIGGSSNVFQVQAEELFQTHRQFQLIRRSPNATPPAPEEMMPMSDHPYVGMWVTRDGHVRQELLPNGRYDEARGTRRGAYQGR